MGSEESLMDRIRLHPQCLRDLLSVVAAPPAKHNNFSLTSGKVLDEPLEVELLLDLLKRQDVASVMLLELLWLILSFLVVVEQRPGGALMHNDAKRDVELFATAQLAEQILDDSLSNFLSFVQREASCTEAQKNDRVVARKQRRMIPGLEKMGVLLVARRAVQMDSCFRTMALTSHN